MQPRVWPLIVATLLVSPFARASDGNRPADLGTTDDPPRDIETHGRTPEASLRSIRVRPGFTVELVAAEPLVRDPIAFDWGPDGRLWALEMGHYPLGGDNRGKPDGRARLLEDTDGDGRPDFADDDDDGDHLTDVIELGDDPTAPRDTDGDGTPDFRDLDSDGDTIADATELMAAGRDVRLLIGPWHHAGGMGPKLRDTVRLLDQGLRGGSASADERPVRVQLHGDPRWWALPTWPWPRPPSGPA